MTGYLIGRLLLMLPTLFGISLVVFISVRFLPGNVVEQIIGDEDVPPELRERLEERYSVNDDIAPQYVEWLGELARGDFGVSIFSGRPVSEEMEQRLPVSFQLGVMGLLAACLVGLPIGILSAMRQNTTLDYAFRSLAIVLIAVPAFWLGLLAITYGFQWFGWTPPLQYRNFWEDPSANLRLLWIPALILGAELAGVMMRLTRSMMLEVLRQDYIRTASAKGLTEWVVITRHALRNALIPVISIVGVQIPALIGGTVILEKIFSIPGMGNYLLTSIERRDYPVVQMIVILSGVVVVLANLVVDLAYVVIDPRIKFSS